MENRKQPPIKPIQLISFDNDKRLVLSEQAVNLFQTLEAQQLHIITVAGKYRTGKSYILNRVLLNQNSGFEVGPTINACTKGLWMWPKIVSIEAGGVLKKCIVIDTEGLGSLEEGENTDVKIFLMAILMSSYLIYNSVGSIDEKAIENLSLIINLAEMLHKNGNQYDSQQLINSFPSFMWLVRDFSLRLENENGEPITSPQYLQNALRYQNGTSQAAERKNAIRKKLKTFFQDRNCFTLVRPTQNQKDLQTLSTLSEKRLRPEFVKLISELKSIISFGIKPKRVRGKPVTPQGFIELCKYFVSTINSGKLPSINSHWDNLCLKEASRIIENLVSEHKAKLSSCNREQDEMDEKVRKIEIAHKQMTKQANEKIDKSFLGKLEKQLCKEKVEKLLNKNYEIAVKQINQSRFNVVKQIVREIFTEIMDEFQNNKLESFEEIFARFEEIKQKYKHDTRIYQSFYENSKDVFQQFLRSLKDHWQREQSVLHEKNYYLQSIIAEKTQQLNLKIQQSNEITRELESRNYRVELQNTQLHSLSEQLKAEIAEIKEENTQLRDELDEAHGMVENYLREQIQANKTRLQEQIDYLKGQNHKLEIELMKMKEINKQSNIKERKTQREMEIFKNKCSEYLKQNIELNEKLEKVKNKVNELEQTKRKKVMQDLSSNSEVPEVIISLNNKINELELKIKIKDEENRNLSTLLNNQKITQQALLRAPQNINYAALKKNYEMEKQTNCSLQSKIKEYEVVLSLCSLKCLLCQKNIDKKSSKSHIELCTSTKSVGFDVSYEYNGKGQIQFVIDIYVDEQQWTIRKSIQNIKHFLRKMNISCVLFNNVSGIQQDIDQNQEMRLFLDQIFNDNRQNLWNNLYLIQYFAFDLNYLNFNNDKFKNSSLRGSKVSIDFESILEENIDPLNTNLLMKTGKFSKKTFNFGNI